MYAYRKTWCLGMGLYIAGAIVAFATEEPHPLTTPGYAAIILGFALMSTATHLKQQHLEDMLARYENTKLSELIPLQSSSTSRRDSASSP